MKIYGHRGASSYAPENTMSAFRAVHKLGAHGIEIDVQFTKDKQIIVMHDDKVDRTTDGHGYPHEFTLSEIRALDAGGWFAPECAGERIPTLEEVLVFIRESGMELNIEIKSAPLYYEPTLVEKTYELMRQYALIDRIIVSSFDHRPLAVIKEMDSAVEIGLLYSANILYPGEYATRLSAQYIHPHYAFVDQAGMDNCAKHGVKVNAWTVGEARDVERLNGMGVNIAIMNNPDVGLKIIAR